MVYQSKHAQINKKLERANQMMISLEKTETGLAHLESILTKKIADASEQLTVEMQNQKKIASDAVSERTKESLASITTIRSQFNIATEEAYQSFDEKLKKSAADSTAKFNQFEANLEKGASDLLSQTRKALVDLKGGQSELNEIKNILDSGKDPKNGWDAQASQLISGIRALKDESSGISKEIAKAKTQIVDGTSRKKSILSELQESRILILEFQKKILGDENGLMAGGELALDPLLIKIRKEMENITTEANTLLTRLTDESVDSDFAGIATKARSRGLWALSFSIFALTTMAGMSFWVFQPGLIITDFLSRFTFLIPLAFAVFLLNRERKIQHVIEIQYRYKSALAKALKGYRNLYDLPHSSPEYMELFNVLKFELLENPMKHARRYLDQDMLPTKIKSKFFSTDSSVESELKKEGSQPNLNPSVAAESKADNNVDKVG